MTIERAMVIAKSVDEAALSSVNSELRDALRVLSAAAMHALEYGERVAAGELVRVTRCKDCAHEDLFDCPLCYIEAQSLQFIEHDPNFYCGKGEPIPL